MGKIILIIEKQFVLPLKTYNSLTYRENRGKSFNIWKLVEKKKKESIAQVSMLETKHKVFDLYAASKGFPCTKAFVMSTPEMSLQVVTTLKVVVISEKTKVKIQTVIF